MSIVLEPNVLQSIEELADKEKRTPSEIVTDALQLYETHKTQKKKVSGVEFLQSIAGQGCSSENDISERDEEIPASEIDPIRGWHVDNGDHAPP